MTKEVAKKIVRGITDKIECNTVDIDDWAEFWGFTREEYEEFLDMAIKALEQQPILDKIRAKIEAKIVRRPWLDFEDRERDRNDAFLEVLDIIDKYKTESEE